MVNWKQNQASDYVKRNGPRFLSLYSTTLLDVAGEDCAFVLAKGGCATY